MQKCKNDHITWRVLYTVHDVPRLRL